MSASSGPSTISALSSTPTAFLSTQVGSSAASSSARVSSSSSSTSTPVLSAAASNSCLRVLNTGVGTSQVRWSEPGLHSARPLWLRYHCNISLNAQGHLIVSSSSPDYTNALTVSGSGSNRNFRPHTNPNTITYAISVCTVKMDVAEYVGRQVLKCSASLGTTAYTGFRSLKANSAATPEIVGTSDLTTSTALNHVVELGLFTGNQCSAPTLLSISL